MTQLGPHEFFTESINAANRNVGLALEKAGSDRKTSEAALRTAEVQAELAKASALAMIANAISECSTPGTSIRYGLADVATALTSLNQP